MSKASKMLAKGIAKSVIVNDKKGQRWSNLYTGKKVNPLIGMGIMAGSVMAAGGLGTKPLKPEKLGDVTPLNSLTLIGKPDVAPAEAAHNPNMLADGTAGNNTPSQAPTLGADGAMVFGMHNKRSGGYI